MKKNVSFTEGKIYGPLIGFTIPIFFSILLQMLYGAVDLLVVGQFCPPSSISAVSTGSQLVMTLISVISNLCMGTSILLGQHIGAGKAKESTKIVGSSLFIFGILSIILAFFMIFLAKPFSLLMKAPPEALTETVKYVRISGYGVIFLIGYNVLGSIFRGMGDSKTPLIAVTVACALNIIGDLVFVGIYNLGASGAAWATIIAQALSILICLMMVSKKNLPFTMKFKDIKYDKHISVNVLTLGTPLAIQSGLVNISFLVIMAITNSLGVLVSAGVGITQKLCGFLLFIQISFGQSMSSYTAHNVGCKKYGRAKKALLYGIITSLTIGLFQAWASFFHGDILLSIFSNEQKVIITGWEYLKAYSIDVFLTSLLFCLLGYFNGFGKTKFTMIQGIIGAFAVRIPFAWLFAQQTPVSLFHIGLSTPLSTTVQNILCIIYFIYLEKQIRKENN